MRDSRAALQVCGQYALWSTGRGYDGVVMIMELGEQAKGNIWCIIMLQRTFRPTARFKLYEIYLSIGIN